MTCFRAGEAQGRAERMVGCQVDIRPGKEPKPGCISSTKPCRTGQGRGQKWRSKGPPLHTHTTLSVGSAGVLLGGYRQRRQCDSEWDWGMPFWARGLLEPSPVRRAGKAGATWGVGKRCPLWCEKTWNKTWTQKNTPRSEIDMFVFCIGHNSWTCNLWWR